MRKLAVIIISVLLIATVYRAESSTLKDLPNADTLETLPRAHLSGVCNNLVEFIEMGREDHTARDTITGFLVWRGVQSYSNIRTMYSGCVNILKSDRTLQDYQIESDRINTSRHAGECSNMNMLIRYHQEGKDVSGDVLKKFITRVAKGWNMSMFQLVDHCGRASDLHAVYTNKGRWIQL